MDVSGSFRGGSKGNKEVSWYLGSSLEILRVAILQGSRRRSDILQYFMGFRAFRRHQRHLKGLNEFEIPHESLVLNHPMFPLAFHPIFFFLRYFQVIFQHSSRNSFSGNFWYSQRDSSRDSFRNFCRDS